MTDSIFALFEILLFMDMICITGVSNRITPWRNAFLPHFEKSLNQKGVVSKRHRLFCCMSWGTSAPIWCSTHCPTFQPRNVGRGVGFCQKPTFCPSFLPLNVGRGVVHCRPAMLSARKKADRHNSFTMLDSMLDFWCLLLRYHFKVSNFFAENVGTNVGFYLIPTFLPTFYEKKLEEK